eukprot:6985203-Alexandrium_andersonii.AAC.1
MRSPGHRRGICCGARGACPARGSQGSAQSGCGGGSSAASAGACHRLARAHAGRQHVGSGSPSSSSTLLPRAGAR